MFENLEIFQFGKFSKILRMKVALENKFPAIPDPAKLAIGAEMSRNPSQNRIFSPTTSCNWSWCRIAVTWRPPVNVNRSQNTNLNSYWKQQVLSALFDILHLQIVPELWPLSLIKSSSICKNIELESGFRMKFTVELEGYTAIAREKLMRSSRMHGSKKYMTSTEQIQFYLFVARVERDKSD